MEIAVVQGQTRAPGGRHANERLRRTGLIPAVIYGHGEAPESVALSLHDVARALQHGQHVVQVQLGGAEHQFLLKDVQYDHLHKTPIHVDLMRVDASERVEVKVRIELRGTPTGAKEGGSLIQTLGDLEVECLILNIPESIRVDVSHLEMNQALHVRELTLPPDVRPLHNAEDIVCVLRPPRAVEEAKAALPAEGEVVASAEPEVIGKGPKETEDEAGE